MCLCHRVISTRGAVGSGSGFAVGFELALGFEVRFEVREEEGC